PKPAPGFASGATRTASAKAERQEAGSIWVSRRARMITIMAEMRIVMTSASALPKRRPAGSAPSKVRTTPRSAATLAMSVTRLSRSPVPSQAIAAAKNGVVALITITSATLVRCSALMKQTVARVEHAATSRPARPIPRITATVSRPWTQTISPAMNRPPYTSRQNNRVQASSAISRVKKPAKLNAAADAVISKPPSQGRSVSYVIHRPALTGAKDSGCMLTAYCQEPFSPSPPGSPPGKGEETRTGRVRKQSHARRGSAVRHYPHPAGGAPAGDGGGAGGPIGGDAADGLPRHRELAGAPRADRRSGRGRLRAAAGVRPAAADV